MDDHGTKDLRLNNWDVFDSIAKNKKLDANERYVAILILRHRNIYNFKCCPSVQTIAELTGLSKSTVKRKIQHLEHKKIIVRLGITMKRGFLRIGTQYYFTHDLQLQKDIFDNDRSAIYVDVNYDEQREYFEHCLTKGLFKGWVRSEPT